MGEIEIQIYNTLGQVVFSSKEIIQNYRFLKTIDVRNLPSGIYFMEVKNGAASTKKMLIKLN